MINHGYTRSRDFFTLRTMRALLRASVQNTPREESWKYGADIPDKLYAVGSAVRRYLWRFMVLHTRGDPAGYDGSRKHAPAGIDDIDTYK